MAALVDLGRPPIVGLVEPEWELARVMAELAELEETCPGYTLTRHGDGAGRGGVEAALRPAALPGVVDGCRVRANRHDRDYTVWPDGLPDYPMPQSCARTERTGG